ncbi:MAG: hypothetical protein JWR18_3081 [Segetibacter sp.]|jgi:hypothetical protein|nr:hypothetical protein [Segetibacter sp.]
MTIQDFNSLPESRKKEIIVDAEKLGEYRDKDLARYELFQVDDFFVEVKVSFLFRYRKIANSYSISEIPRVYSDSALKLLV